MQEVRAASEADLPLLLQRFIALGEPVIFRGAALNSTMRAAFAREPFIRRYTTALKSHSYSHHHYVFILL